MARAPNVELESLSDVQIRELIEHAREVIGARFSTRVDELRSLARDAGYEITVTKIGESAGRGRRGKAESSDTDDRRREVTPKYHNPDNHSEKWSGRGRKPKWIADKLASGKSLDDLLIRPEPSDPAMTAD